MNGWMKRIWNWMEGPLLSTAPPKTADAGLSLSDAVRGNWATQVPGRTVSPPNRRKIGGNEAIERISWHHIDGTKRDIPIYANGDTPVNRALRDLGDAPEPRPTLSDVNAIRVGLSQRITFENERGRTASANVMRRASDMLGYLSRELVAQDRKLFEAQQQIGKWEEVHQETRALADRMETERDTAVEQGARIANALDQSETERDEAVARAAAFEQDCDTIRAERDEARAERDCFEGALDMATETSAKLSCTPIASVMAELETARAQVVKAERQARHDRDHAGKVEARNRKQSDTIGQMQDELRQANENIVALSQPRVINVAGLVDADLAERYESLRTSFDLVNGELTKLRRPVSGVSLYREIDALGGTFDPNDLEAVGYSNALDEVIAILEQRGFTEQADPAPVYSDGDREKAAQAFHDDPLAARDHDFEPGTPRGDWCFEVVDCVAGSLGMRRAGA